jgi:hypothetical protein
MFLRTMGAYDTTAVTDDDIDEYVRCYTAPGAWRAAFEYYRAWFDDVRQNEVHGVTPLEMPVLAIGGAFSSGPFPELSLREVASDVTGRIIEQCGHWIASEQPDELTEALLGFLGAATPAALRSPTPAGTDVVRSSRLLGQHRYTAGWRALVAVRHPPSIKYLTGRGRGASVRIANAQARRSEPSAQARADLAERSETRWTQRGVVRNSVRCWRTFFHSSDQ